MSIFNFLFGNPTRDKLMDLLHTVIDRQTELSQRISRLEQHARLQDNEIHGLNESLIQTADVIDKIQADLAKKTSKRTKKSSTTETPETPDA